MTRPGTLTAFSLIVGLVVASPTLGAHHGRAGTYTGSKPVTGKATIVRFEYKNPHIRVFYETKDESGKVTLWSGEMANVSQFVRAGWTKARMEEQLKPGAVLTFTYLPAVTQTHSGDSRDSIVMRMINEKGEVVGLVRGGLAEALAP
jgi:hypothetical protein